MRKKGDTMIQCKRVYDDACEADGYRVLVDRLWPRGVKKEALQYDEWCKDLTPSAELRKAFHGEVIDFASFCQHYREELNQQRGEGLRLATVAREKGLTLLYAAKNTQQNHALVLADWLAHLE
ncbi:YeaO family protein [Yokenella regensburgei ATCC 49455]|uniref:Uncharacterized conserved protein n=2 Tax=Yokenella regensburgei TaxID=158877 RepID=A0AB38FRJ2_9ENTR|nr:YeaO family protein [Yokenella regensburgei ATCC 49455]SQA60426.1 Uncharacterized conserved protein [Yokenella regensburgei]SQA67406.1 Uncharacterized conserved protein [Yokenella regensburgei]SUQ05840.1 Uncharacterized conserved protein [Yokenella regensburgei]